MAEIIATTNKKRRGKFLLVLIAALVILGVGGWFGWGWWTSTISYRLDHHGSVASASVSTLQLMTLEQLQTRTIKQIGINSDELLTVPFTSSLKSYDQALTASALFQRMGKYAEAYKAVKLAETYGSSQQKDADFYDLAGLLAYQTKDKDGINKYAGLEKEAVLSSEKDEILQQKKLHIIEAVLVNRTQSL